MELWGEGHATHKQRRSHVGESYHKLLGLPFDLNGQLSGGGQDQSYRAAHTVSWFLKIQRKINKYIFILARFHVKTFFDTLSNLVLENNCITFLTITKRATVILATFPLMEKVSLFYTRV